MAKLTRVLLNLFGADGVADDFAEFGSQTAGVPVKTKDVATIQLLDAWKNGWKDAIVAANRAPFLEDMNALQYVHSYMTAYILQEGIPEWDPDTTYFIGGFVRKPGTFEVYGSLINDNQGNALPSLVDNANWQLIYPVSFSRLLGQIVTAQITDGAIGDAQVGFGGINARKLATGIIVDSSNIPSFPYNPCVRVGVSAPQNLTGITNVKVNFVAETFDVGGGFDIVLKRFTAPTAGKYLVNITLMLQANNTGGYCSVAASIFKNGGQITEFRKDENTSFATPTNLLLEYADLVQLDAGDYVEIFAHALNSVAPTSVDIIGGSILLIQKVD